MKTAFYRHEIIQGEDYSIDNCVQTQLTNLVNRLRLTTTYRYIAGEFAGKTSAIEVV